MYTSFSIAEPDNEEPSYYSVEAAVVSLSKVWHVNLRVSYDDFTFAALCGVTITPPEGESINHVVYASTDPEQWQLNLLYEVVQVVYKYNKSNSIPVLAADVLRSQGIDIPGIIPKYVYAQCYEYKYTNEGAVSYESVVLDTLQDLVDLEQKIEVNCCYARSSKLKTRLTLRTLIIHWNDTHKYSLLEIADRLEALDADIELKELT